MEDWKASLFICGLFCCYVLVCMEDWKNTSMYWWLGLLVTLSGGSAEEVFPAAKMPHM
jgi:hypothetical protein